MNGDLPSMAGYYDPPDEIEPKEVTAEFTLEELLELSTDGVTDSLLDEIGLDAELADEPFELVGLSGDGKSICIRARYYPGEPDHSDEAYDRWRDEQLEGRDDDDESADWYE